MTMIDQCPDWCSYSSPHTHEAQAVARASDPDTSHAAAASLTEDEIRESQRAVLRWLRAHGPCTDETLVVWYAGKPQSPSGLRTRRRELVNAGLVRDSGQRWKTRSGRRAIVWEVV